MAQIPELASHDFAERQKNRGGAATTEELAAALDRKSRQDQGSEAVGEPKSLEYDRGVGVIADLPLAERADYWFDEIDGLEYGSASALRVNAIAQELGLVWVEAKVNAAELYSARKLKKLAIMDELVKDKGYNKTTAADMLETQPDYLEAVMLEREGEELRDRAEVYYRIAFQRAEILKGG